MALAVALFLPQHPLVQPVAELLFTLPLLLLFIRFVAPSMRQLSRYPASVQCQFGIVPLVGYLFDYITHVYTSLLSEANPAAVEFMFFVCCAAFLCSILRASRVERQRIQMEQLQTSLNLQVTQAMREIEALRLSQQRASTYRTGHGLGVRSICAISERYGGLTSFAAKDGQFTLRVIKNNSKAGRSMDLPALLLYWVA